MKYLVIVRYYRYEDEFYCREIIKEGTMSTVNTAFIAGLTPKATFQTMVLLAALKLIFLGAPFGVCVRSVPAVIMLMCIFIWFGHTFKAIKMTLCFQHSTCVHALGVYRILGC
jgi:hypothetical protein